MASSTSETRRSKSGEEKTPRPHDALFKAAFEQPERAAVLFRESLPESVSAAINWDTLTPVPGSFIDPKLDDSHTDLLFSVRLDGAEVLLYVLLEHQSTVERDMVFRMLEYLVRIWRRYRKQHRKQHPKQQKDMRFPLIIPLLVSHAPGGWTGPLTLADLLEPNPNSIPGLAPLVPNFSILLEDLVHLSNDELKDRALDAFPKLALWLLRDARDADTMFDNFAAWTTVWREALATPSGMEAVAMLLRYIWCVCETLQFDDFRAKIREQLPEAEYAAMTIAEQLLEEGRAEGLEKGLEKGARLGRADSLSKLIALKFGDVEPEHLARIEAATLDELDGYIERILTAKSIEELLSSRR